MKHFLTGMLISGICTMSPLYAFGPAQGSNWGMPMMNWGNTQNTQNWNNAPATYWGNMQGWNAPSMNGWNTPNWNTQSWPPFNFSNGNAGWPTITMPTINWQNTPTWNGYPTLPGNFQNRNMPAMIYQPVVPVRILPAPVNRPVQAQPIPPIKMPLPEIPAQVPPTVKVPPPTVKPEKIADTIKPAEVPKPADGTPVFPTADDIPSELKDIKE